MKRFPFLLAIFLFACSVQDPKQRETKTESPPKFGCKKIKDLDVLQYTLNHKEDTIHYIKIGTDTTTIKPAIVFLQGSLPIPLVIDFKSFKHVNIPFRFDDLLKEFHLIEISMPQTPVEADIKNLNKSYCFITDSSIENSFKKEYLRDNYLENYVSRTHKVLSDLLNKNWIDKGQIHLVGHSQGAKIATVVASQNENVTSVSLLGFNAYGRFDETIRRERNKLRLNLITEKEYLSKLDYHYQRWEEINSNPNETENGNLNWTTFSINYIPYLLKIDVPVFVGFGTEDISAENCDLLPLVFIENKKSNLTIKPYIGLDHNFFEVVEGMPDYEAGGHWNAVMNDITLWIKQINDSLPENHSKWRFNG